MYLDNKYTKWYYSIVEAAKLRSVAVENAENHHIIPESFFINRFRKGPAGWLEGDPEDPKNKVKLTGREHIICHILLVKMTEGAAHKKMVHGLWMMTRAKTTRKRLTARQYEFARKEFREVIKVKNTGSRRPLTQEEKLIRSTRLKGIPKTEVTKNNMKTAWKSRDRTVKDETRSKLKKSVSEHWASTKARNEQSVKRKSYLNRTPGAVEGMIANINRRVICKHCGTETNIGNHNRWHGDRCRLNNSVAGEVPLQKS